MYPFVAKPEYNSILLKNSAANLVTHPKKLLSKQSTVARRLVRLRLHRRLESFRLGLGQIDALPQLVILGLLSGLATGAVIELFRFVIEQPATYWMPDGLVENFEGFGPGARIMIIIAGSLSIGLLFTYFRDDKRKMGIAYVVERLHNHQGYLPLQNGILQFFGAAIAIISGQSVGREGPAVHLGATGSSLNGQWLRLPNNSLRTLVGCGTAAAIAASFNTPLAGVIFAMEVVMMEYTLAGFAPIIIAAVTGAAIAQISHGQAPAFLVPDISMHSLWDFPLIVFEGFVIGCAAALFIYVYRVCTQLQHIHIFIRIMLAGILTALVSVISPEIMGIGYDSMEQTLNGQLALNTLIVFFICKLLISAIVIGLGMPGGLIGPTLLIGALLGGIVGVCAQQFWPNNTSSVGLYTLLGMTAMMGAVLSAPLSALMTVLELTNTPGMMLPSMMTVMTAFLTCRVLFKQKTIFESASGSTQFSNQRDHLGTLLQRVCVTSVMSVRFKRCKRYLSKNDAIQMLAQRPQWIIVQESESRTVLRAADLANYLPQLEEPECKSTDAFTKNPETNSDTSPTANPNTAQVASTEPDAIDLLAIPGLRKDAITLDMRASLGEALEKFEQTEIQTLLICRTDESMITPVVGILTRDDIENYYHIPH